MWGNLTQAVLERKARFHIQGERHWLRHELGSSSLAGVNKFLTQLFQNAGEEPEPAPRSWDAGAASDLIENVLEAARPPAPSGSGSAQPSVSPAGLHTASDANADVDPNDDSWAPSAGAHFVYVCGGCKLRLPADAEGFSLLKKHMKCVHPVRPQLCSDWLTGGPAATEPGSRKN